MPSSARARRSLLHRSGWDSRQAADGTLPLYVGGTEAARARAAAVLDAISENQHVIGTVEQAYAAKLAINYVSMSNLAVLLEGFGLGTAAGIDPQVLCTLMQDGGARSFQSDVRLPWIIAGDYTPRFGIDLAQKDMRLAIDLAARYHAPAATGAAALQHFSAHSVLDLAARTSELCGKSSVGRPIARGRPPHSSGSTRAHAHRAPKPTTVRGERQTPDPSRRQPAMRSLLRISLGCVLLVFALASAYGWKTVQKCPQEEHSCGGIADDRAREQHLFRRQ